MLSVVFQACVCPGGLRYVVVVEHDLSVLDYLSDFICCLYGVPGAYGVVTMPFSVREGMAPTQLLSQWWTVPPPSSLAAGINIFLDGFVPTENLRFRETSLVFKVAETADEVFLCVCVCVCVCTCGSDSPLRQS